MIKLKNILKEVEESILKEYVSNPILDLKRYLNMSNREQKEDLVNHNSYLVTKWINKERKYDSNLTSILNQDDYEIIDQLKAEFPEDYTDFLDWSYSELTNNPTKVSEIIPAWYAMKYKNIVKNQWLIHFSDNADDIWTGQKFKYGLDDLYNLGYSSNFSQEAKKYGGYNFSYDINDFSKYGRSGFTQGKWKYGNEAVMFRASGVKVWHWGDDEPQVIFWGATATDIIYLRYNKGDTDWQVSHGKTGRIIYKAQTLSDVVKWIVANYNQYKSVLMP